MQSMTNQAAPHDRTGEYREKKEATGLVDGWDRKKRQEKSPVFHCYLIDFTMVKRKAGL